MYDLEKEFLLNPEINFLNFGSFGACPKPIFDNYQYWQRLLEYQPVEFLNDVAQVKLEQSRAELGQFIGCHKNDLVYVSNPSYAVNLVVKSLNLKKNDEVLTTNLEYGACDKTWQFYAKKYGFTYVNKPIQLPIISKEQFIEDFFKGLTPQTKIIFLSAITSMTALILPYKEICQKAKEKGLLIFIDGAHLPGHVNFNLNEFPCDFFTGACHKWLMTPKGSSFLYAHKDVQPLLEPLVVSWGYDSTETCGSLFLDYHEWQGTRDISTFLTIPEAIRFREKNQWNKISDDCRQLVLEYAPIFCDLFKTKPISPLTTEFIGQMFSIPIFTSEPLKLKKYLLEKYKIEIPVMVHSTHTYLRYSINGFNNRTNLNDLFKALVEIKKDTTYLN
ncbi:MAG: aminotransferase class V-fold PLP-dependent enzyme [Sediminibacterium sp.]|nr:aminotransferase class V-fold PLP-dependent enzyme [Sediminibacterium sp.]